MMAVGLIPVFYLKRKSKVSWKVFGLGVASWLSVYVLKTIIGISVSSSMAASVQGKGALLPALVYGLYVGLQTGIFDTGFSLIWARRFRLFGASFEDAVAFGAGFAGVEALALGLGSFLGIFELLMNPSLMSTLSPSTQQILSAQYALGPAFILPPIIGRASNLFIDCFAIVMVFMAIRGARGVFWIAAAYASIPELATSILGVYLSDTTLVGAYLLETPYVLLGLVGLLGLLRSRTDPIFRAEPRGGANSTRDGRGSRPARLLRYLRTSL
jgi:uncharacterized membrane protein YhfC